MSAWLMLLRREWWEHKAGFGWTPLAIGGLFVLFALYVLGIASVGDVHVAFQSTTESAGDSVERSFEWNDALRGLLDFTSWSIPELERYSRHVLHLVARPFVYAHFVVAVFVLAGALNDDRRDRSVLFWKSLPVSDLAAVTSKLVLVVWIAPLVTVTAIVATWIGLLALVSAFAVAEGAAGFGRLWAHAGIPGGALAFVTGYLLQGLWTLPVYAWLLVVSAAVPRVPFAWAGLAPLLPVALERLFLGSNRLWVWITEHLQLVALPRPAPLVEGRGLPPIGFADQFALLLTPELWSGVAVGALLLACARWLRQRNNDL